MRRGHHGMPHASSQYRTRLSRVPWVTWFAAGTISVAAAATAYEAAFVLFGITTGGEILSTKAGTLDGYPPIGRKTARERDRITVVRYRYRDTDGTIRLGRFTMAGEFGPPLGGPVQIEHFPGTGWSRRASDSGVAVPAIWLTAGGLIALVWWGFGGRHRIGEARRRGR